jgi:hypothetical protein
MRQSQKPQSPSHRGRPPLHNREVRELRFHRAPLVRPIAGETIVDEAAFRRGPLGERCARVEERRTDSSRSSSSQLSRNDVSNFSNVFRLPQISHGVSPSTPGKLPTSVKPSICVMFWDRDVCTSGNPGYTRWRRVLCKPSAPTTTSPHSTCSLSRWTVTPPLPPSIGDRPITERPNRTSCTCARSECLRRHRDASRHLGEVLLRVLGDDAGDQRVARACGGRGGGDLIEFVHRA